MPSSAESAPAAEETKTAQLGDLMHQMLNPTASGSVAVDREAVDRTEKIPKHVSSVENMMTFEERLAQAESAPSDAQEPANSENTENLETGSETTSDVPTNPSIPELELKVKGFKELQKIALDPENEKLREYVGKGMRFDRVMQETAKQRKLLEQQIQKFQNYGDLEKQIKQLESAKQLLKEGHGPQALGQLLGDDAPGLIENLVDEEIRYRNASPSERLEIELERRKRSEQLERQKSADKIAELEAQINNRSVDERKTEFSGYIQSAKDRYDLSQWVDDPDVSDLNSMLQSGAMAEIVSTQRQKEARGENPITEREIRRIFATKAKKIVDLYKRQASKLADEKIEQQSKVATKNAQVTSTQNYGKADPLAEWQKSGGSMMDLLDMMNPRKRV